MPLSYALSTTTCRRSTDIANDFYAYSGVGTDVAGLGQADSSFGEAPKGAHTLANSAELRLSTNASTSFNDGEYILFGHDDAAVSFSQVERPNGKTTAQKTDREWRVDLENASSQSVDVSIAQGDLPAQPSGFNDYAVFVDEDGDFSSGATFVDLEQNGTRYEASGVSISDGDYVTIAAVKRTITFATDSKTDFENTGTTEPALSLELNFPNQSGLTLGYEVSKGSNSPTNDTDYETCCEPGQSATFTFPANQTTYDLQNDASGPPPFGILDEGVQEGDTEFVDVVVDPSSNGFVTGGNATAFEFGIVDDDQSRTASLGSDNSKGEGSGSNFTVNVTLSSDASGSDVTVDYELSGSATAGEDYENLEASSAGATTGTVTIPDGSNSTSFNLKISDDGTFETDETIDVTLVSAEGGATLKDNSGNFPSQTLTITDDESQPTVALSASSFTGTEGSQATATVQLSAAAGTNIDVQFSASNGPSAESSDYSTATSSPVTIPAGQTEASIAFDLTSGDGKEKTEAFSVTLTGASPVGLGTQTSADVNILDNDGVGGKGPGGVGNSQSVVAWLAADQLPLSDGSEVTTWPDRSGNGNDATVSAGNGPTFQANVAAFNDQPVVRFTSGNNDYLNLSGVDNLGNGPNTVFAVSATNTDGQQGLLTVADVDPLGGSVTYRRNLRYNTGTVVEALNGGGIASTSSVSSDGTPAVLGSVFDGSQVDVAANRESPTTSTNVGTGSGTSAVLGAGIQVSNGQEARLNYLDGDIAELIVFDKKLIEAQRIAVANYLAAKYGLSLSQNDYYKGDTNAGFSQNVIGVGADGGTLSDQHTKAEDAGVRLAVNSFSAGEYVFVGDTTNTNANDINVNDASGVSNLTSRSAHLRYLDTKGQPTFDITINLDNFGLQGPAGDAANYRLLYRSSSGSGSWSTPATVGSRSTSGDEVTFNGVQFGSSGKAVYITIGTTNQVASPLDTRLTTVRGNAGADQTDEGWRYYGPPGSRNSGPVQMGEIRLRTPSGNVQTVDFRRNMSYTWSSTNGKWVAASSSTPVPNGRGAILFLYDDEYVPLDPELTIDPKESGTNGSFSYTGDADVTVGDGSPSADGTLAQGVDSHLLANPYDATYDLRALQTLNQDGDSDGTNDWSTAVQVWTTVDGEGSGDPRGTYKVRSTDPAKPQSERLISPGQAFFLERSDKTDDGGGLKTQITFSANGRQENEATDFLGTKRSSSSPVETRRAAQIKLRLQVRDSNGDLLARDRAASLYFREGADSTWDAFDAPKLTPMEESYATIAIQGAGQDGSTTQKAQESRPYAIKEPVEFPLALTTKGVSGKATLSAPEWWSIPPDWELTLVDTKGTSDPSDDVEHELGRNGQGAYTFSVEKSEKRRAEAKSASRHGFPPAPPSQLKQGGASRLKSTASPDARFRLRVSPNAKPLPVEMAGLRARTDGQSVLLQWTTASEKNNAGFAIEHQRLSSTDTTASPQPGAWTERGFVEGEGTTETPQEYQYRVRSLDYGRHVFRLRQVDTDGSSRTSRVVKAEVRLEQGHAVGKPYPNPARRHVRLEVTVRKAQPVRIELYDILGRHVRTIRNEKMNGQETHRVEIGTQSLSSGPYFLRVSGDHFTETRRLTVVK